MFLIIINKSVPEISIHLLTGGAAALFASICLVPIHENIINDLIEILLAILKIVPTIKKSTGLNTPQKQPFFGGSIFGK